MSGRFLNYREIEAELVPLCRNQNLEVLCYNPLAELKRLSEFFNKRGKSITTALIAWVLAQSEFTSPISRGSRPDQLDLTLKAADFKLDEGEKAF
jgi:aryl-alcohol dehydrogenase-like predicted oxidoreductase